MSQLADRISQACSVFIMILLSFEAPLGATEKSKCTDIRLDLPGQSMEHVPPSYQGDLGLCYAYTAAQLVDAWRFSHDDHDYSHLTSALEVAVGLAQQEKKDSVLKMSARGEHDIQFSFEMDDPIRAVGYLLKNGSCDKKIIPDVEDGCHFMSTFYKDFYQFKGHALSSKGFIQPLEIGFCAQVLVDHSYKGRDEEEDDFEFKKDCENHSALLMGRRYHEATQTCQFLIQDSSEKDCKNYQWECDSSHPKKIWIDERSLYNNIKHVEYLEEAP